MNDSGTWLASLFHQSPDQSWITILDWLRELALSSRDSLSLHLGTVTLDRVLAEAAWDLWEAFPTIQARTSSVLKEWWGLPRDSGRAVLVVDALSLRELPLLIRGAKERGLEPALVRATAAEVPTDTDSFAAALGAPSRASLANNSHPGSFALNSSCLYTEILESPFLDCLDDVKPVRDLFLWHTVLDTMIHAYKRSPEEIASATKRDFLAEGFWALVNKMRQGRRLIITSDHGYAVSELFSTEEEDPTVKGVLQQVFGAARYAQVKGPIPGKFVAPLAVSTERWHSVIGQRRWKVRGGFPSVCHGGLSLLEAAVPFIEFPEAI